MKPDQAKFLFDFFLPQLKSEQITTSKVLRAIPPDKGDYTPDPRSRTAMELAVHIVGTEMWFLDAQIQHVFRDDDEPPPATLKTGAELAGWYEENFVRRLPLLEALSGEHLATPVNYIGVLNNPAVTYLSLTIRHAVHHRGQLSAYLRPMGAKVPAIYIESADERNDAAH